ncbi:hypothetical protein AVEN_95299-1 [Araneus ventricosus]|uniref:Uncharacterized protein n=1 Tax=Araneus ventricosus TaxID=182803 RepID=A0A4Y2KPD0_ARAVE|nr:hypothetical protein AVEN_95299-1 [Araneus ventricosus]
MRNAAPILDSEALVTSTRTHKFKIFEALPPQFLFRQQWRLSVPRRWDPSPNDKTLSFTPQSQLVLGVRNASISLAPCVSTRGQDGGEFQTETLRDDAIWEGVGECQVIWSLLVELVGKLKARWPEEISVFAYEFGYPPNLMPGDEVIGDSLQLFLFEVRRWLPHMKRNCENTLRGIVKCSASSLTTAIMAVRKAGKGQC